MMNAQQGNNNNNNKEPTVSLEKYFLLQKTNHFSLTDKAGYSL